MENQSSTTIWTASSTVSVAVREPNDGFSYPGAGALGRGMPRRPVRGGGESLMRLALVVANSAVWIYASAMPVGLAA
jgi:hypothetical protein